MITEFNYRLKDHKIRGRKYRTWIPCSPLDERHPNYRKYSYLIDGYVYHQENQEAKDAFNKHRVWYELTHSGTKESLGNP